MCNVLKVVVCAQLFIHSLSLMLSHLFLSIPVAYCTPDQGNCNRGVFSLSLCSLILGGSCSSREAAVTDLVSSGEAIWAATEGGHVVTFDPTSTNVLLVHRRYSHVSSLVCLGAQRVVVFGRERVEGVDGEDDEEKQMFAVWDSYIKYRVT